MFRVLDGDFDTVGGASVVMLEALDGFDVALIDANQQVHAQWPPGAEGNPGQTRLPAGIRLRLETADWGVLERTLLVGG